MDSSEVIRCTVVHSRLFPGPITDPGNPLRVEMLVEVGAQELIIRAPAARANGRVMGTEPLAGFERVTMEHLSERAQRIEIMRRSLLRMALVGGIIVALSIFVRGLPPGVSLFMALVVAALIGPLNFLLNGGLGKKQDVVRFHFMASEPGHTFYLEVPAAQEIELRQALLPSGLHPEEMSMEI
jgi:hypothetical protein